MSRRGNVNTLATGDWAKTTLNSRYKGLNVGKDKEGFYLFYRVNGIDIMNANRYETAIDIPIEAVNEVLVLKRSK